MNPLPSEGVSFYRNVTFVSVKAYTITIMKKKLFLLFALSTVVYSLRAQVAIAYFNPNYQTIGSKSFQNFASSYASVNANVLSDWDSERPGVGWTIGIGMGGTDHATMGLEYSRSKSFAEFNRTDGGQRKFSLHSNMLNFRTNILIGNYNAGTINGMIHLGAGMGRAVIKSSYTQGSTSVNSAALDGKYTGFHGEISAGLSLVFMFSDYIGIKAGCTYNTSMWPIRLDDKEKDMDYDSLPQDFATYSQGPTYYVGEEVKDDFRYLQFRLGILVLTHE